MGTQTEPDRCHRCDHQRRYHTPRCTKDCPCGGFLGTEKRNANSARRKAKQWIDKAILELRDAFSSDAEIKKEMREAVDRIMNGTNGD